MLFIILLFGVFVFDGFVVFEGGDDDFFFKRELNCIYNAIYYEIMIFSLSSWSRLIKKSVALIYF